MTLHVGHYDSLRKLFSVSLIPTVVLYLYVKVKRAFAAVDLLAVLVRTDVLSVDLLCCSSVVLLAVVVLLLLFQRLLLR